MSQTRLPYALLFASLSTLTLAACGGRSVDERKSAAPAPPIAEMDAAMERPAPMPLSASDTLTPVMPSSTAPVTGTAATTFVPVETSVAPVAVAVPLSMEDRMAKLEQSVNSLRSDYDRIMPAFASLNTTNERIQTLLDEMETQGLPPGAERADVRTTTTTVATKATETPVITAPAGAMKAAPTAEETVVDETQMTSTTITTATPVEKPARAQTPKAASSAGNAVTAVRIGEHGSKTRVVFDLSGTAKPDFKYDLDNAEHLLLIDMPASSWTAKDKGTPNSPMIAGWSSQKGANGGSAVAVQLKKDARVLSTEFLKPEGGDPARLVMDIAAGG